MIKLPTYHHPYRGTVPFHQSVRPSLRGGASRSGKPLSGSAPLERQPTPVSSSVFSQQRAEKMYRERLWLLHFNQTLLDTRSSRRALEVTYAGFRTRNFRQFECFFAATRRKIVSGTAPCTPSLRRAQPKECSLSAVEGHPAPNNKYTDKQINNLTTKQLNNLQPLTSNPLTSNI